MAVIEIIRNWTPMLWPSSIHLFVWCWLSFPSVDVYWREQRHLKRRLRQLYSTFVVVAEAHPQLGGHSAMIHWAYFPSFRQFEDDASNLKLQRQFLHFCLRQNRSQNLAPRLQCHCCCSQWMKTNWKMNDSMKMNCYCWRQTDAVFESLFCFHFVAPKNSKQNSKNENGNGKPKKFPLF